MNELDADRSVEVALDERAATGLRICALGRAADIVPRGIVLHAACRVLLSETGELRREAIRVLGKLQAVEAIDDLVRVCRHIEGDSALTMIRTLEKLGSPEVEPGLIELLEQPELDVSLRAAEALESLGSLETLQALGQRAASKPRSTRLIRAIQKTRHTILERIEGDTHHRGGLTMASALARGELSEVHGQGFLTLPASESK